MANDYTTFEHDVLVIGAARSADTLVRMSVASTRKIACGNTIFAGGTGDADKSVRAPFND